LKKVSPWTHFKNFCTTLPDAVVFFDYPSPVWGKLKRKTRRCSMKERRQRKKDQVQPLYTTYALSDVAEVDPVTGAATPTELGVKEAKDWVDHNHK